PPQSADVQGRWGSIATNAQVAALGEVHHFQMALARPNRIGKENVAFKPDRGDILKACEERTDARLASQANDGAEQQKDAQGENRHGHGIAAQTSPIENLR